MKKPKLYYIPLDFPWHIVENTLPGKHPAPDELELTAEGIKTLLQNLGRMLVDNLK